MGRIVDIAMVTATDRLRRDLPLLAAEPWLKESHLVAPRLAHAWLLKLEQTAVAEGPRRWLSGLTVVPPPPGTSMVTP